MDSDHFYSSCGERIWYCDAFCIRCGEPNLFFRLNVFKAEHGGNSVLEEMIEEGCRLGHPGVQKDIMSGDRDIYLKYPYCSVCGANLVDVSTT